VPARLELLDAETRRGGRARLLFEEPVRAAAPGQSAVFYAPDRPELLLGGGRIDRPGGTTDSGGGRRDRGCAEGGTV
jgi:tRNA (5-methylaminomethyl-2-thiouridylate)-methyltransferase (EC 2.1.1.61)